ncbi:hypothetical protein D3C83_181470 [compost metagenome]
MDKRSDISRSRAAVRASSRFATFEPAMKRISSAVMVRIVNGCWNWLRSGDGPVAADRK